jgi:hypothetical protein
MRPALSCAVLASVIALSLSACSTPKPVRDLATRTAANSAQVAAQLKNLNTASENVAHARATNVALLMKTVRDIRERHSLDIALTKKSGDGSNLKLKEEIAAWIVEARAAAHAMTVEEFKAWQAKAPVDSFSADIKTILSSLESLDTKSQELTEVGKVLAELSKEEDLKARAQFLVGYAKQVYAEVEEKRKVAEESADAAKSTVENAAKEAGVATTKAAKAPDE